MGAKDGCGPATSTGSDARSAQAHGQGLPRLFCAALSPFLGSRGFVVQCFLHQVPLIQCSHVTRPPRQEGPLLSLSAPNVLLRGGWAAVRGFAALGLGHTFSGRKPPSTRRSFYQSLSLALRTGWQARQIFHVNVALGVERRVLQRTLPAGHTHGNSGRNWGGFPFSLWASLRQSPFPTILPISSG